METEKRIHSQSIHVLQWGMLGDQGGVESFLMNIYRHIDRSKVQFDFLTSHDGKIAFEDEIQSLGGKIYQVTYGRTENPIKAQTALLQFYRQHPEIKAVHMNACFMNYITPLVCAKKCGVPIRIFHSHNAGDMYPSKLPLKKWLSSYNNKRLPSIATHCFACSDLAGKYMFGKLPFRFIPNAIDTQKYAFNSKKRIQVRKNLNIGDEHVLGFAGRLQYQKNPLFLMRVYGAYVQKDPRSVLMVIGKGDQEDIMRTYAKEHGFADHVLFLGQRGDVQDLYQAMDLFLLPSRFEGLGIVLVEAQCAGLPCLASADVIPPQVKLTNLLEFVSLSESAEKWAENALHKLAETERRDRSKEVAAAGFEIRQMAKEMEAFYLEQVKRAK